MIYLSPGTDGNSAVSSGVSLALLYPWSVTLGLQLSTEELLFSDVPQCVMCTAHIGSLIWLFKFLQEPLWGRFYSVYFWARKLRSERQCDLLRSVPSMRQNQDLKPILVLEAEV